MQFLHGDASASTPRDVAAALALGRAALAGPPAAGTGVAAKDWLLERMDQALAAVYCQPPFMFHPTHQVRPLHSRFHTRLGCVPCTVRTRVYHSQRCALKRNATFSSQLTG